MPTLQKQLQIHLYRLPAYILKTGSQSLPWQMPQFVESLTQPSVSLPPCNGANSPPGSLHTEMHPASVLPSPPIADSPPICLPAPPPTQQYQTAVAKVLSQTCSQGFESKAKHPGALLDVCSAKADKTFSNPFWTSSPGRKLQKQQEQEDTHGVQHEEDKAASSVKATELQSCPTTDPQYVLRSQNPPECASLNTQTGLTNGFPQKGVLQHKHKIRVDFKVSSCSKDNMHSHF